ncbi:LANO_0F07514g1_1 [Lachancea nothofagi CBS 11611]|uniref:LANO_0F07514g1_1 n=1 Tax=Lachancea nothofagi CBS 11611 TaxID=1266666 RepID=A0A1G4K911_9SACH|nr:LANO_0F07514g1_1 [Lachancea nothofagi CBS 11611]
MNDLRQAIHLIEALYSPHPPPNINEIQQQLQTVQRSEHGLELASQLLSHEAGSVNVEYFGALTLAVQLHTKTAHDGLGDLLEVNMLHLAKLARLFVSNPSQNGSRMVVIKKLMSNAAQVFFRLNSPHGTVPPATTFTWKNPLETFCLLTSESSIHPEAFHDTLNHYLSQTIPYDHLIQLIGSSNELNSLTLLFSEVVIEDLVKYQSSKVGVSHLHGVVHEHLYITSTSIMNYNLQQIAISFQNNLSQSSPLPDNVFRCVNAWINYATMARSKSQGHMDLSETFEILIQLMCLHDSNQGLFPFSETVVSILGEIFGNDPTMLNYELRSSIEEILLGVNRSSSSRSESHQWMLQYMNHLVVNQMFDELKELALCVVDFLQISNLDVCNKLFTQASNNNTENLDQYIKVLLQMTNFTLVPVLEEFFSVRMADFWLDLCDAYNNLVRETFKPETPELAANLFGQVVQIYLPKIQLINKQKIVQAGEDDSLLHEFDDFRGAILDLIESMWAVLGNDKLTNVLIASIGHLTPSSGDDLFQIEAMCFCLNKLLVDMNLSESPGMCKTLSESNSFLTNVLLMIQTGCQQKGASNGKDAQILSCDLVKTSTSLLATVADYVKKDERALANCMDVLFNSLESCSNADDIDTKIELLLTKCTTSICETSRLELASYLPTFIKIQSSMVQRSSKVSDFTKQKFTRCLGYIIQNYTQNGPEAQAQYLAEVINTIKAGIMNAPDDRQQILCLLTCFSELGSALVPPEDSDNQSYLSQLPQFQEYWRADPPRLRELTLNLIESVLSRYGHDAEFIEVTCLIMGKKLTLSEEEPHFLAYSMQELMDFLLRRCASCEPSTGLPYIVYLLESVVNRYGATMTPQDFSFMLSTFFLGQHRDAVANDPDLTQIMITFVNSVLETRPGLAVHCDQWTSFILPEFLRFLASKERFTISAVTKFWTKVVNNKKFSRHDEVTVREQVCALGPQLTSQAMRALLHAQRSDLSYYSDFLRALIARYPLQSKQWLSQALPPLCDNNRAHQLLVEKLLVTRGSRAASNAVLEWWLNCNGLPQLT